MTDCIIKQFGGCFCEDGECADQARHQRTADLLAKHKAAEERFRRNTRRIINMIAVTATIGFIGLFYAVGSRADTSSKTWLLDNQENTYHVARR